MDISTLKVEAICSSEMSLHTRTTWHHIPEDSILLKLSELDQIHLDDYKLSATYCGKYIENGEVCIFCA
jgi:hypothetical protein